MKSLILAAAMALTAFPAAADEIRAADSSHARAVSVRYADLDLSRTEDAEALLSRLTFATTRACAVDETARPNSSARRAAAACREAALSEAVARLDAPELTRLYADRR
jgi:UrcA family protein